MQKILHLIPYDGTGGVESAARSMAKIKSAELSFQILFIFKKNVKRWETFNPMYYFISLRKVFFKKPDVLIVSLWRSCLVGLMVKVLAPKTKIILMLHYPENVHVVDRIVTLLAALISQEIWSDSQETMKGRLPSIKPEKQKVITFVTKVHKKLDDINLNPNFIFWGRLHQQKGLDSAIKIFSQIQKKFSSAKFTIIGPDGGELGNLKKLTTRLLLDKSVTFYDAMTLDDIKIHAQDSAFFLQPSILEGMGIAVIEAMQFGLVPIVTAVGEMQNYCKNMHNSILILNENEAMHDICSLLTSREKFFKIRNNAINTWEGTELYSDSMLRACKKIT